MTNNLSNITRAFQPLLAVAKDQPIYAVRANDPETSAAMFVFVGTQTECASFLVDQAYDGIEYEDGIVAWDYHTGEDATALMQEAAAAEFLSCVDVDADGHFSFPRNSARTGISQTFDEMLDRTAAWEAAVEDARREAREWAEHEATERWIARGGLF